MRAVAAGIAACCLISYSTAWAQTNESDAFVYDEGFREAAGLGAIARTAYLPSNPLGGERSGSSSAANSGAFVGPPLRYLASSCFGPIVGNVVQLLDRPGCREPIPPRPSDSPAVIAERLPSPEELAWVAADRAMSVAEWPELEIAPSRVGLTGLRSFFWLDRTPAPVTASASIPGLVVTAEAHPVEYTWSFGEGRARTTPHPGRAWTKRRPGNVAHMYEQRGRYRVSVEVLWQGRWRVNSGAWQHLGYFSNSDSRTYPVRQMIAMLSRRR